MPVREVKADDRAEWLRMLMRLYPGSAESDLAPAVDAYLTGTEHTSLLPVVVFVTEGTDPCHETPV